jgi:hypothetical protein
VQSSGARIPDSLTRLWKNARGSLTRVLVELIERRREAQPSLS